ncbi:MAG: hypothetical protein ACPGVY_17220 [Mycobacterium sp.]
MSEDDESWREARAGVVARVRAEGAEFLKSESRLVLVFEDGSTVDVGEPLKAMIEEVWLDGASGYGAFAVLRGPPGKIELTSVLTAVRLTDQRGRTWFERPTDPVTLREGDRLYPRFSLSLTGCD